jgi:hypothetical protein
LEASNKENPEGKGFLQKANLSRYDLVPFIPYCLFLPALRYDSSSVYFGFTASIIGILLVLICYFIRSNRIEQKEITVETQHHAEKKINEMIQDGIGSTKIEQMKFKIGNSTQTFGKPEIKEIRQKFLDKEKGDSDKRGTKGFLIFNAVYVIIAGLAITNGIDNFMGVSQYISGTGVLDLIKFTTDKNTMVLYSFLAVATLFYNCGILFLSKEGFEYLTTDTKKEHITLIIFFNVIIIFAEGVILYFISHNTNSIASFALWLVPLMSVDAVWTYLQRFMFLSSDKPWKKRVPFEWIHLDLLVLGFLWFFLIALHSDSTKIPDHLYLLLLIVLVLRTVVDYIVVWTRVWSRFNPLES